MFRRILSALLCLCMVLSMLPIPAFAETEIQEETVFSEPEAGENQQPEIPSDQEQTEIPPEEAPVPPEEMPMLPEDKIPSDIFPEG